MIKASHFSTHRLLVNDAVVMSKFWEVCVTSAQSTMKPECWPVMAGAPSVVTDTSLSNDTFFSTKNLFTALQMSTPLMVVFRGSSVRSWSFAEKSSNTIGMNIISCDVLLLATDLLRWMLKHLHLTRSRSSCSVKFPVSRHSSNHRICPELDIGESGDDIGTILFV